MNLNDDFGPSQQSDKILPLKVSDEDLSPLDFNLTPDPILMKAPSVPIEKGGGDRGKIGLELDPPQKYREETK